MSGLAYRSGVSLAFALILAFGARAAGPSEFKFVVVVQIDQAKPEIMTMGVKPGETKIIEVSDGYGVGVVTPSVDSEYAVTIVRLQQATNGVVTPKAISRSVGGTAVERGVTFGICGGEVVYASPTPPSPFKCG